MKEQIQKEFDLLDKTNKEDIKAFVSKSLASIMFDFEQNMGFPNEMFQEELAAKDLTDLDKLLMILAYIKEID